MKHSFALVALLCSASFELASAAKAKARRSDAYNQVNDQGTLAMNANQQAEYDSVQGYPQQQMQQAPNQQYVQYDQPQNAAQYQMQNSNAAFAQMPMQQDMQQQMQQQQEMQQQQQQQMQQQQQPVQQQQASFLATAAQAEPAAADAMTRLAGAIAQQNQALVALEAEQHQLAELQSDFAQRSLNLFERLAKVPHCDGISKPGKVEDDASCEKACKDDSMKEKAFQDGEWKENEWSGIFGKNSLTSKTYRCDCLDKDNNPETICNNSLSVQMTISAFLGLAILMFHM